jgi:hypothetical protein
VVPPNQIPSIATSIEVPALFEVASIALGRGVKIKAPRLTDLHDDVAQRVGVKEDKIDGLSWLRMQGLEQLRLATVKPYRLPPPEKISQPE